MTLGPFDAHRTMEALEHRLVYDLDAYRLSAWSDQPLVVSCVCDQSWGLPPGYLRELLYGKPQLQATQPEDPKYTATFGPEMMPCLFRDPLYRVVSAVTFLERRADRLAPHAAQTFINPWALRPASVDSFPGRVFAVHSRDADRPVMAWVEN